MNSFRYPATRFGPALVLATAILIGCRETIIGDDGSLAVVRGQIVDTAGAPVASAGVRVSVTGWLGDTLQMPVGFARSGVAGLFETTLFAFLTAPFDGYLFLEVLAPANTGLRDTIIGNIPIRFARAAEDTADVSIILTE